MSTAQGSERRASGRQPLLEEISGSGSGEMYNIGVQIPPQRNKIPFRHVLCLSYMRNLSLPLPPIFNPTAQRLHPKRHQT
jgi:hypothetical protein